MSGSPTVDRRTGMTHDPSTSRPAQHGHLAVNGVNYYHEIFLSPQLVPTVLPFLEGAGGPPSWSAQVAAQPR